MRDSTVTIASRKASSKPYFDEAIDLRTCRPVLTLRVCPPGTFRLASSLRRQGAFASQIRNGPFHS